MNKCRDCAAAQLNIPHLNGCWAVLPKDRTPAEINITPESECVNGLFVSKLAGIELANKVKDAERIKQIKEAIQ